MPHVPTDNVLNTVEEATPENNKDQIKEAYNVDDNNGKDKEIDDSLKNSLGIQQGLAIEDSKGKNTSNSKQ